MYCNMSCMTGISLALYKLAIYQFIVLKTYFGVLIVFGVFGIYIYIFDLLMSNIFHIS